MSLNQKKRFSGFTLLELMLVLVIIASILLLAAHYYRIARENTRINQAIQEMNLVVDASFKYLEGHPIPPNVEGMLLIDLVKADLLPEKYNESTKQNKLSPWLTTMDVHYIELLGTIAVEFEDIPEKSCVGLLNKIKNQAGTKKGECSSPDAEGRSYFHIEFEAKGIVRSK